MYLIGLKSYDPLRSWHLLCLLANVIDGLQFSVKSEASSLVGSFLFPYFFFKQFVVLFQLCFAKLPFLYLLLPSAIHNIGSFEIDLEAVSDEGVLSLLPLLFFFSLSFLRWVFHFNHLNDLYLRLFKFFLRWHLFVISLPRPAVFFLFRLCAIITCMSADNIEI